MRLWPLSFTPHLENKPGPAQLCSGPSPPGSQPLQTCASPVHPVRAQSHAVAPTAYVSVVHQLPCEGPAGGEMRAGQVLTAFDPQPVSPLLWTLVLGGAGLIIQTAQGHGPWVGASLLMLGWVSAVTEGGWN